MTDGAYETYDKLCEDLHKLIEDSIKHLDDEDQEDILDTLAEQFRF